MSDVVNDTAQQSTCTASVDADARLVCAMLSNAFAEWRQLVHTKRAELLAHVQRACDRVAALERTRTVASGAATARESELDAERELWRVSECVQQLLSRTHVQSDRLANCLRAAERSSAAAGGGERRTFVATTTTTATTATTTTKMATTTTKKTIKKKSTVSLKASAAPLPPAGPHVLSHPYSKIVSNVTPYQRAPYEYDYSYQYQSSAGQTPATGPVLSVKCESALECDVCHTFRELDERCAEIDLEKEALQPVIASSDAWHNTASGDGVFLGTCVGQVFLMLRQAALGDWRLQLVTHRVGAGDTPVMSLVAFADNLLLALDASGQSHAIVCDFVSGRSLPGRLLLDVKLLKPHDELIPELPNPMALTDSRRFVMVVQRHAAAGSKSTASRSITIVRYERVSFTRFAELCSCELIGVKEVFAIAAHRSTRTIAFASSGAKASPQWPNSPPGPWITVMNDTLQTLFHIYDAHVDCGSLVGGENEWQPRALALCSGALIVSMQRVLPDGRTSDRSQTLASRVHSRASSWFASDSSLSKSNSRCRAILLCYSLQGAPLPQDSELQSAQQLQTPAPKLLLVLPIGAAEARAAAAKSSPTHTQSASESDSQQPNAPSVAAIVECHRLLYFIACNPIHAGVGSFVLFVDTSALSGEHKQCAKALGKSASSAELKSKLKKSAAEALAHTRADPLVWLLQEDEEPEDEEREQSSSPPPLTQAITGHSLSPASPKQQQQQPKRSSAGARGTGPKAEPVRGSQRPTATPAMSQRHAVEAGAARRGRSNSHAGSTDYTDPRAGSTRNRSAVRAQAAAPAGQRGLDTQFTDTYYSQPNRQGL